MIGTGNQITDLFKFVGKYKELKECKKEKEINNYNPQTDNRFKRENLGYSIIRDEIEKKYHHIPRKYLKNISRKWPLSRVVLSFETPEIISQLFTYIREKPDLKMACIKHFSYDNDNWHNIMPIQFEFLGVRLRDHHKNWKKAEMIINKIRKYILN